jgi:hypothetical protein
LHLYDGLGLKEVKCLTVNKLIYEAMKKIILITLLIFVVTAVSFARKFVAEGKTFSALGNYKIEVADNYVMLGGTELKTFVISYENSDMEAKVAIQNCRNEKRYIVICEALSVQYVCHGTYFGVELLDNAYEKDGHKTSSSALNRSEYFHQKAITTGENCELDQTKLIAAYFPLLLNNQENIIAEKK